MVKSSKTKTRQKKIIREQIEIKEDTSGLTKIADFLSGEVQLQKKQDRLEELKSKVKEKQRDSLRNEIKKGVLEIEPEGQEKKVVQNIKLYEWIAPVRVKYLFDFKSFLVIVSLMLLFILYLAILGHYNLMGVMIALVFFIYVAGVTEPDRATHHITARGIDTFDKLFEWFLLEEFVFSKKNDSYLLIVETKLRFPTKLIMLLDEKEIAPIFMLLQDKILYKNFVKQNLIDKMAYGEFLKLEDIKVVEEIKN